MDSTSAATPVAGTPPAAPIMLGPPSAPEMASISAASAAASSTTDFAASFMEMMARLLADRQPAAPSGPTAAAPENGAAISAAAGQLLKDPPLFEAKLTLPAFMTWKDKFLLYARKGGRTSPESAISSGNAYTLRAYWYGAKESLPDMPAYEVAKATLESNLCLQQQEHWLQLLEQVLRFNTCSEQPVRPKFDSFNLKWTDESNLDLEDLASSTRLRLQSVETYDTEDHFQASVSDFRRVLEMNGFRSIGADMGHQLGAQHTEEMTAAARGALLASMIEAFEHRLHQAMRVIRDHKVWLQSPAADLALQRATPKAAASAMRANQQQQQKPRHPGGSSPKAHHSSHSSGKKKASKGEPREERRPKKPLRLKTKSARAVANSVAASH